MPVRWIDPAGSRHVAIRRLQTLPVAIDIAIDSLSVRFPDKLAESIKIKKTCPVRAATYAVCQMASLVASVTSKGGPS